MQIVRRVETQPEWQTAHGRPTRRIAHVPVRSIALGQPAEREAHGEDRSVQQKRRAAGQPARQVVFGAEIPALQAGSSLGEPKRARTVEVIVNSGATDHMVNDHHVLKDCWAVDPITITTAKDGEIVVGKKRGVLKLKSILKEPI